MGGRILIADDMVTDRIALKARLAAARYEAIQAVTPEELGALAREARPDAILLDMGFPGGGVAACRALKADPASGAVPVLIHGAPADRRARLAAIAAGAEDCLPGLPPESLLLAHLRTLMRQSAERAELLRRQALTGAEAEGLAEAATPPFAPPPRVTLVAPEPAQGVLWQQALGRHCPARLSLASSAAGALTQATPSDAYIIGQSPAAPGAAAQLLAELRARPATRHALVFVQAASGMDAAAETALDLGADAVLRPPFSAEELVLRLDRLMTRKRAADRLRAQLQDQLDAALRDPLTGLFNRRYAERYLSRIGHDGATGGLPCAVLLIDLDHFKAVNDRHGHPVGDDVLAGTARRISRCLREIDLAARIGGEEFLVVLRDTPERRARAVAERLRAAIAARPIRVRGRPSGVPVTVSIGVVVAQAARQNHRDLIERADRALYASKAGGRNTVTIAPDRDAA